MRTQHLSRSVAQLGCAVLLLNSVVAGQNLPTSTAQTQTAGQVSESPRASGALQGKSFSLVEAEARQWLNGKKSAAELNTAGWGAWQFRHFLRFLPRDVGAARMDELDQRFHFTASRNMDVTEQWLLLTIANHYMHAGDKLEKVLMTVDREDIILPLYEQMAKKQAWRRRGIDFYNEARSHYSPRLRKKIEVVLGLSGDEAAQP